MGLAAQRARTVGARSQPGPPGRQFALTWLTHPAALVAIAVLLLNDHVLKAEFGSWWTGKLSDVAGLVFFPALMACALAAVAPRLRPRVVAATSIVATGLAFAWVKATTLGAATASAAWSAVAGPSLIRQDATDLLALPALAIAWWAYRRAESSTQLRATVDSRGEPRRRTLRRRIVATLAVAVAVAATVATSFPPAERAVDVHHADDSVWVGVAYSRDHDPYRWYRSRTGVNWIPVAEDRSSAVASQTANAVVTEACVPNEPQACYRIVPGEMAVEESADGGATWSQAWALTDTELAELERRILAYASGTVSLEAQSLAIVPLEGDDYRVVVATIGDGVTTREPDGTWTRRGFTGFPFCDPCSVRRTDPVEDQLNEIPEEDLPYNLRSWWGWGFAAFGITALATAALARPPGHGRWWRFMVAAPFAAVTGIFAYFASVDPLRRERSLGSAPDMLGEVSIAMMTAVFVGMVLLALGSDMRLPGMRVLLWAGGAAVSVAVVTGIAETSTGRWPGAAIAAAVTGAVILILALRWAVQFRRRVARDEPSTVDDRRERL